MQLSSSDVLCISPKLDIRVQPVHMFFSQAYCSCYILLEWFWHKENEPF